ncbi:MAG: hypothetical protein LH609_20955, partial [Rudanella sp.]|nr:hypothetical protein [Rudanella sp.]
MNRLLPLVYGHFYSRLLWPVLAYLLTCISRPLSVIGRRWSVMYTRPIQTVRLHFRTPAAVAGLVRLIRAVWQSITVNANALAIKTNPLDAVRSRTTTLLRVAPSMVAIGMLMVGMFIGQKTYAQNVVTNGDFTSNTTGWTLGSGWVRTSSASAPTQGFFLNNTGDGGIVGNVSQTVSGVPTNGTTIKFQIGVSTGASTNGDNAAKSTLTITYAGVNYGRLSTNNTLSSNVVALNGATINTNTVTTFKGTGS